MRRLLPLSIALMLGMLATFGLFEIAHAQGLATNPIQEVTVASSTGWDLVQQFGPIWGGMLLLYGLMSQVVKAGFFQKLVGKRLAGIVALIGVFAAVLEAHFGSGSWAGVIVTLVGAVKMLINPSVQGDPSKSGPAITKSTVASLLVGALLIGTSFTVSCGTGKGPVGPVINSSIDCTIDNGGKIAELLNELRPAPGHSIDWSMVYQRAKDAGATIGGCVLIELAQQYLTSPEYASVNGSDGWTAIDYAEKFRHEEANDAVYHTQYGDL